MPKRRKINIMVPMTIMIVTKICAPTNIKYNFARLSGSFIMSSIGSALILSPPYLTRKMYCVADGNSLLSFLICGLYIKISFSQLASISNTLQTI